MKSFSNIIIIIGALAAIISIFAPLSVGLPIMYLLMILAVLGAILFPLVYMIKHPKESKMTFMGMLILFTIFLIGWVLSGGEVTEKYELLNVNATESKLIGGSLIAAYIIGFLAIVFTVGSQIVIAIRKS